MVAGTEPVVICDGITNGTPNEPGENSVTPDSETGDSNPYAAGIRYNVPGITLNLDGTIAPVDIVRTTGQGVASIGGGVEPNVVNALGTVNIETQGGSSSYGIYARNTVGAATINYNDGTINVGSGWNGFGVYADTRGSGDATINYNSGSISTTGNYSIAVYAQAFGSGAAIINYESGTITGGPGWWVGGPFAISHGDGDSIVNFEDGTVTTSGWRGFGVYAGPLGSGDGAVNVTAGTISTSGVEAIGAHVYVIGPGALLIDAGQALNISTSGADANGLLGTIQDDTNAAALDILSGATISTSGARAHGIWGWHGGSGTIQIDNTGNISALGVGADGIRAEANSSAGYSVNVADGSITSGAGSAAGIHVLGTNGGTISIATAAGVDGSASGIAISDGDLDGDGVDEIGGDVVVTSAGTVTGNAILGLGDDTFNLAGGALIGDIFGDDASAVDADGDDAFNWSGGDLTGSFFGSNGSDTAVISNAANFTGSEVLDGGDNTSTGDGWVDTLSFNDTSVNITASNLLNWETIVVENATVSNFDASPLATGSDVDSGLILSSAGIFNTGNEFNLTGNLVVASDAIFNAADSGASTATITGAVSHQGVFNLQDGDASERIIINGDYSSDNGQLNIDTVLGDDSSASDLLTINGDAIGSTTVNVQNVGGSGAQTIDGIEIVQVSGLSSASFLLDGDYVTSHGDQAVIGGAYAYTLSQQADGDWALVSELIPEPPAPEPPAPEPPPEPPAPEPPTPELPEPEVVTPVVSGPLFQPAAPIYEAFAQNLLATNNLPTLQQRIGNRSWAARTEIGQHGSGAWTRYGAGHRKADSHSTTQSEIDTKQNQMQFGFDHPVYRDDDHELVLGINASYSESQTEVHSVFGNGELDTESYSLGSTATWYAHSGFYADGQIQLSRSSSDLASSQLGQLGDIDSDTWSVSLETGKRIALSTDRGFTLTPQIQLRYADIDFDRFTGIHGEQIALAEAKSLKGRLGLTVDHQKSGHDRLGRMRRRHLYGIANIIHDFDGHSNIVVSGIELVSKPDRTSAELGIGGSYNWSSGKYTAFGELTAGTSLNHFGDDRSLAGTVGFRVVW